MAKGNTSGKKKEETQKSKGSVLTTIFLIIISLVLIITMRTGFIFIVLSMLPTIIAYYMDRKRPRTKFHTVFACNLSGTFPFLMELIREGKNASSYTTEIMSNMVNWLIIYSSAGFGYLLLATTPFLAQLLISMVNKGQIARFESMQERIIKEWGNEVSHLRQSKDTAEE